MRKKYMKHKLESRLAGEISITSDMQMRFPAAGPRPRAGPGDGREAWRGRGSGGVADRKSTRLNSSHSGQSRMPSSA